MTTTEPNAPLPSNEEIYKGLLGVSTYRPEQFDALPDPLSPIFPGQQAPEAPLPAQGVPPEGTPADGVVMPPATPESSENEQMQLPPLPPELVAKYEGLETYLEHRLGAPLDQIIQLINGLSGFQVETTIQTQRAGLQSEWGVDKGEFDRRLSLIKEELATYPESARAGFDTVEGAKKIWGYISAAQSTVQQQPNVPLMVRTQVRDRGSSSYDYKQSDIRAMTPADYKANSDRITQAYLTKRVLID